ncbi:hypothetical protein B0J14DRAFT_246765 [Halenospora varia]|nr:hypothetical protein B0J14DRAFT_246765 [Halenospora varia]
MISTASPVSSISTMSGSDEKHVVPSPVEPGHYFPDDKIVLISHEQPPTAQFGQTARSGTLPPGYQHELAATPRKPFWKRHLILLVGLLVIVSLVAGIVIGILVPRISKRAAERQQISVANNVKASVAATGLFLKDKTTWNTQTFWQNTNGTISYQMSTDGSTFSSTRNVTLYQRPKVGSPISATAATDNTGVVYLTLFYVSEEKKIAMAALACAAGSSSCSTVANNLLTTTVPIADTTGLAAVNVDNAQDWRVYYQDQSNQLSQLQGNASGFDRGTVVGGLVLNGSSIAAVNCNATTNNINIFYVDMLTQVLYGQQFTKGDWTQGTLPFPPHPPHH